MGNTNKSLKMKQFKQIKRQSNTLLGTISQVEVLSVKNPQEKEHYIMKVMQFNDKLVFEERCLLYNRLKCLNKSGRIKNLLNVIQTHESEQSNLCSQNFTLYVFMDHYESDLESLCLQKDIKKQRFSEFQIIQIIKAVIVGLLSIEHNCLVSPFLSKKCIVFTEKQGVKLIPNNLIDSIHPYHYFLNNENMRCNFPYLSPQAFKNLGKGIPKPEQISTKKANIFTLGMLALQLAVNHESEQLYRLYNFNCFKLQFEQIERLIRKLQFSQGFKELLRGMLQQKEGLRFDLENISEIVNKPKSKLSIAQPQKGKAMRNFNNIPNILARSCTPTVSLTISDNYQIKDQKNYQSHNCQYKNISPEQIKRNTSISSFDEYKSLNMSKPHRVKITLESKTQKPEKILRKKVQLGSKRCLIQVASKKELTNFQFQSLKDCVQQQTQIQISRRKNGGIKSNLIVSKMKQNELERKQRQSNINEKRRCGIIAKNIVLNKKNLGQANVNTSLPQNLEFDMLSKFHKNQSFVDQSTDITFSDNINKIKLSKNHYNVKQLGKSQRKQFRKVQSEKQNVQPRSARKQAIIQEQKLIQKSYQTNPQVIVVPLAERSHNQEEYQGNQKTKQNRNNKFFTKKLFANGARYEGQIQFISVNKGETKQVQEIFSGSGTLYYPSNKVCYRGQWNNNKFNGFGILHSQNAQIDIQLPQLNFENFNSNDENSWFEYEGQFRDDLKNGYGVLKFKNGEKYQGRFSDDRIDGVGVFFSKENRLIRGYWKNNKLLKQQ